MPLIERRPGQALSEVWIYLSQDEIEELRAALDSRAEDHADGLDDPEWHVHIGGPPDSQITIGELRVS